MKECMICDKPNCNICKIITKQSAKLSDEFRIDEIENMVQLSNFCFNKYFSLIGNFYINNSDKLEFSYINNNLKHKNGIYVITAKKQNYIIKIGSTTDSFNGRVGSFLSGNPSYGRNNSNTNFHFYKHVKTFISSEINPINMFVYPQPVTEVDINVFGCDVKCNAECQKTMEYIATYAIVSHNGGKFPLLGGSYGIKKRLKDIAKYYYDSLEVIGEV